MTEQEAIDFCKNDPESAAKIILMIERLTERIKELEAKLNMNSSNSSKPPSTNHLIIEQFGLLSNLVWIYWGRVPLV